LLYALGVAKRPVQLRISDDDLAEIDRRAKARGLDRSAFVLSVVLDPKHEITDTDRRLSELEAHAERTDRRCDQLERDYKRLEELV
jgi:uncharacterized protein (DUF1778 family)